MKREQLLKMLNLDKPAADDAGADVVLGGGAVDNTPASPTALELDAWGLRRGRELAAESERLKALGVSDDEAADCFGAAFEPSPKLAKRCESRCRGEFFEQLLSTAEYRELHARTQLCDAAAEIAAGAYAAAYCELRDREPPPRDDGKPDPAEDAKRDLRTMRAVAGACNQAKEDVGKFQDATDALGLGAGSPGAPLDPARLAAAFKRVQNSERLKAIANLAGRFRRVAQSKQRAKLDHGLDDVVGVEPGGDLSRVLPVELARLGDDDLELDVLRRLVERQAQCREWHAVTPVGKGPIVVCVDESGSMTGPKIATAKALALALVWIARRQRRWVGLVGFSGGTQGTVFVCPPDKNDENGLCDWLEHFFGQGTELDVPLRELPAMWAKMGAPKGKTDVLLVTDAIVQCGADLAASFNAWKKTAQARVFALVIGGAQAGDLTLVSDEVHAVNAIDASSDAVGAVLSV